MLTKPLAPSMMLGQILQEGLRLHQAGRLAEAELHYRQLLAQRPRDPDALHYLGLLAYQAQQYETAARLIGESIAEKADDPAAYSNLGNALAMLTRIAEAEAAFRGALSLDPEFADAWFNLGNILREQQRLTDADAAYRRVIALSPNHAGAFNNLANLLVLQGCKEEAAEAFDHLGDVLQDAGRTADAANAYRQAQDIWPNPGLEVKIAFLTPVVPMSVAEIDRTRERLITGIAALTRKASRSPTRCASEQRHFSTAVTTPQRPRTAQGFADFYLGASPDLAWRAPHCASYSGAGERIKMVHLQILPLEPPMTKLYGGSSSTRRRRLTFRSPFRSAGRRPRRSPMRG